MKQTEQATTTYRDPASDLDRLLNQPAYGIRDMLETDSMDKMYRLAEQMATSRVSIPEHLRGNVGDCLAIITQAMLWNMNPFAVAQKTHIVSGRLGYEAQLINAVVQNSGAVVGSPRYEYRGDGEALECRAGFVERGQTEITWGEWLCKSKITTLNSPLWKTNPKQQLGYLQLKNWARAFCPGAILGVYSTDELEDQPAASADQPKRAAPAQAAEKPAAPTWPDDRFAKSFPAWKAKIEDGTKTVADILAFVLGKFALTPPQRAAIEALAPAPTIDADGVIDGATSDFVNDMNAAEADDERGPF
jgi:hypothetical protein